MPLAHIAGGGVHPPRQHRAAAVVQADERAILRKLLLNVVQHGLVIRLRDLRAQFLEQRIHRL